MEHSLEQLELPRLPRQWTIHLADQRATQRLGQRLGQVVTAGTVLLLNGNLGSGKTTLVQGLGQELGIEESIVSPTFTLVCEYPEARIPLYHLDLYRLQPIEVEQLYLDAYWQESEMTPGVVAIEWAERLQQLPASYLQIDLTTADPTDLDQRQDGSSRQAEIQAVGAPAQLLLQQLMALMANDADER